MKRTVGRTSIVLCLVLALLAALAEARPQGMRAEKAAHPRIVKAIHSLEDAIDSMQKAPHDFGGHREDAIRASRAAIEQLRLALAYRAGQDNHRH
jgi:multidrug efflux pump subunit AcrA (membrane-fusion protein)